jgi:hypothetical protein
MTIYRERLLPGPWTFIVTALVIPAALLVFLPINPAVGVVAAAVMYAACVVALVVTSPVIEVTDEAVVAGRARVPLKNVGAISTYLREEARQQRGPVLDSRAWLVIRGWVDPVVKVEILDDRDPAPYWLLSSRQPTALASAVEKAKALR